MLCTKDACISSQGSVMSNIQWGNEKTVFSGNHFTLAQKYSAFFLLCADVNIVSTVVLDKKRSDLKSWRPCVTQCVCVWVLAHAYANPPFPNRVRRSDTIKLLQPLFVLENKSTSRLLMLLLSSGPVIVLNVLHLKRKGLEVFPQVRSVSWALKFWPAKEKKPFKLKLRCRSDSFGSNNNKLYYSLDL